MSLFCRSWTDLKDTGKTHKFQIGYFWFTFIHKISQFWHIWCRCCLSLKHSLFWKLYKDTHLRTVSEEVYVAFKRRQRYIQLTCRIIQTKTSQMKPFPLLMDSCLENIYFYFAYIVLPHLMKRRSFVRGDGAQLFYKTRLIFHSTLPLHPAASSGNTRSK